MGRGQEREESSACPVPAQGGLFLISPQPDSFTKSRLICLSFLGEKFEIISVLFEWCMCSFYTSHNIRNRVFFQVL